MAGKHEETGTGSDSTPDRSPERLGLFSRIGIAAAVVSAMYAGWQAHIAERQVDLALKLPVKQAKYIAERSAYQGLNEAFSHFSGAYQLAMNDFPSFNHRPVFFDNPSSEEYAATVMAAKPVPRALFDLADAINKNGSIWPEAVQPKLLSALDNAKTLAHCFEIIGEDNGITTPEKTLAKRNAAIQHCNEAFGPDPGGNYDRSAKSAISALKAELDKLEGEIENS